MFNLKALAATALVAATTLVAAPSAQARTCFDLPARHGGGAICNSYQGSNRNGDSVYRLGYSNGRGAETGMTVICRGSYAVNWESNGNMSYSYTNTLADYFCAI